MVEILFVSFEKDQKHYHTVFVCDYVRKNICAYSFISLKDSEFDLLFCFKPIKLK